MRKTMAEAIQDEITAFVANQCSFSAYTITKNLRIKVNTGALEIDGLSFENIAGVNTQKIEHDTVRQIVHQICGSGLPGYDRNFVSDPNSRGGGHFEWAPYNTAPSQAQSQVQSGFVTQVYGVGVVTAKMVYTPADPNDPVIIGKVTSYFDKRLSNGIPATLHSTQRRLKRNPLTIDQIKKIATANNYVVEAVPGKPESDSVIKAGKQAFVAGTVSSGVPTPKFV